MPASLTINLVTRNRPALMVETVARTVPNISLDTTRLMISVDADDEATIAVLPELPDDPRVVPNIAPREDALGEKYNRALQHPASLYLTMADYVPHLTPGFDAKLLEAAALFPDNIGVVYTRMLNASFPATSAITSGLVDRLGWLYPPFFPYWFVDHWMDDIARMIDRISFCDIATEHHKKPGTQELREPAFWATLFDAAKLVRRQQAREIILSEDFIEPAWRKELLLRSYPLVEYRSQAINDGLRSVQADVQRDYGTAGFDERYARIKQKGCRMMLAMLPALQDDWRATP